MYSPTRSRTFIYELRVGRYLELLRPVWFETERPPVLETDDAEIPTASAIPLVDQCVGRIGDRTVQNRAEFTNGRRGVTGTRSSTPPSSTSTDTTHPKTARTDVRIA